MYVHKHTTSNRGRIREQYYKIRHYQLDSTRRICNYNHAYRDTHTHRSLHVTATQLGHRCHCELCQCQSGAWPHVPHSLPPHSFPHPSPWHLPQHSFKNNVNKHRIYQGIATDKHKSQPATPRPCASPSPLLAPPTSSLCSKPDLKEALPATLTLDRGSRVQERWSAGATSHFLPPKHFEVPILPCAFTPHHHLLFTASLSITYLFN